MVLMSNTKHMSQFQNVPFCPISASPMSAICQQAQILILPRRINPRNTTCIPACPVGLADRTGVVNPRADRLPPLKVRDLRLNLEQTETF